MRLIDADELIEHAWRDKLDSRELIVKMIEQAPTIKEIPIKIPIDIFDKLVSQEPILDKIRAEMVKQAEEWKSCNPNSVAYKNIANGLYRAVNIIDKYRKGGNNGN